jgi:antitoxin CptB
MTQVSETAEARLKRLAMRSMRRGIKEMDLILSAYAEARLTQMDEPGLTLYDALLSENDQEIYSWILGREPTPERFGALVEDIAQHAGAR